MKTEKGLVKLTEVYGDNPRDFSGVGIPDLTAKLIERTEKKAMYYRWDNVWEVFRIKIVEEGEAFGKIYQRREMYPGNDDFGKTAFCFHSEENARKMYKQLPNKFA